MLNGNAFAQVSPFVNSLEKVSLNGTTQWIYITAHKANLPVLLVVHGGPGFVMLPLLHQIIPELENYFTIVNWDQRLAGKSFSKKIPLRSLTLAQYVDDTHKLTLLLKKRFKTNKIYLIGHSFGTMIGLLVVAKYPSDYYAFIGVGQVVSFAKNEMGSYKFALNAAKMAKNKVALRQLKKIGKPNSKGFYKRDSGFDVTSKWVEYFGGSLYGHSTLDPIYNLIFNSNIYKNNARKILKGYKYSEYVFNDKAVYRFNLKKIAKSIVIPSYFLMGKYDEETPYNLVEEIVPTLPIKNKQLITFYQSAHFPFYEEPINFLNVMKQIRLETEEQTQ